MRMFLRVLCIDFRRMLSSWKFYVAIFGIFGATFISIWPEVTASKYTCSVYYLVSARGGLGVFLMVFTVFVVLPYGLSHWEDVQNNYIYCLRSRTGVPQYCGAHVCTAAAGAFLAVFLGYALCFCVLAIKLPLIQQEEIEMIQKSLEENALGVYDPLILQPVHILYFIAVFSTEAMGYSFLAVFTLIMSVKIENVFLLFSMPIMLYYGSILLCNILELPGIFRWYYIMKTGGYFSGIVSDIRQLMVCVVLYFGGLTCFEYVIFMLCVKKRRLHG